MAWTSPGGYPYCPVHLHTAPGQAPVTLHDAAQSRPPAPAGSTSLPRGLHTLPCLQGFVHTAASARLFIPCSVVSFHAPNPPVAPGISEQKPNPHDGRQALLGQFCNLSECISYPGSHSLLAPMQGSSLLLEHSTPLLTQGLAITFAQNAPLSGLSSSRDVNVTPLSPEWPIPSSHQLLSYLRPSLVEPILGCPSSRA